MGTANLILLSTGLILQALLCLVLLRARTYWEFPFFFAYTAYSVVGTIGLLATSSHYRPYVVAYWTNEAGLAVFAILSLHEIFRRIFFGFYVQFRWFRLLFPGMVIFTALFVIWAVRYDPPVRGSSLLSAIVLSGIGVNFMKVGLFCLFIAIARSFHLRWQFAPLGIILGFAIDGIGSAIDYWVRSEFGTKFAIVSNYAAPVAYILAIVIWLDTFFFRPEPGPGSLSAATMLQLAEDMRRDTMILKKLTDRLK